MSTISSGTTLTTALVQTGDTTGDLVIKTGASNTTAMTISGSNQSVTLVGSLTANTNASTITTGTVPTARLATGTANSSTYLRGDQTWATVASSQWVTSGSDIYYSSGRAIVGYTASVGTAYQTNIQVKGSGASNYAGYGLITSNNESAGLYGVYSNGENSLWIASDPDNLRPSSRIVFSVDNTDQVSINTGGNFQFNSGYGSVATAYGCRAWVNFGSDGSIRGSGNVSSVTRNTTGDFSINFASAMPDTNYSAAMSMRRGGTNDVLFACPFGVSSGTAFSTGSLRIRVFNQTPSAENPETGCVQIFR